jgi:hypothetical protein
VNLKELSQDIDALESLDVKNYLSKLFPALHLILNAQKSLNFNISH